MEYLYNSGINPIRFTPSKGISIWGQKTLGSFSLDRLNVRLLLIELKLALINLIDPEEFNLIDDYTYNSIRAKADSLLKVVKARYGVYNYEVICDDSNNSSAYKDMGVINLEVMVQPTKSVESIKLSTTISSSGLTSTETEVLYSGYRSLI